MNSDAADRLRNWAADYVTGTLCPADREALERELLASEAARRFFVSYLELHAGLGWQFRGADCELPVLSDADCDEANSGMLPAAENETRSCRRQTADRPRPGHRLATVATGHTVDAVRVAPPAEPVVVDADLSEWNHEIAFRSACLPSYDDSYFVEGLMMYDAEHLYIAAHVGDPEPMRNVAPDTMEFAGGSVIVRVSTDRKLGWPLRGTMANARSKDPKEQPLPDSVSDRVVSIILSHDARTDEPRIRLQYGFNLRNAESQPSGWRGAFRKDADGRGYSLEYAIPWRLLHCENDPPRAGDVMAALWMVHWSDTDGRLCRGQLVEVTNPQARSRTGLTPATFFADGTTWGRAVYQRRAQKSH